MISLNIVRAWEAYEGEGKGGYDLRKASPCLKATTDQGLYKTLHMHHHVSHLGAPDWCSW
jgi:hypothetical protein